jgi:two-component system sensor histidine kinase MprB
VQLLSAEGGVRTPPGTTVEIPESRRARQVAAGAEENFFSDVTVAETHLRVLTAGVEPGVAIQVARSLEDVDRTLKQLAIVLVAVALGGIAIAAALGMLVARATLAPVRRLTETAEEVTRTQDLSRRIHLPGRDELSRLAASFNAMLEALQASVQAQRQLVADASHELRTPLTSLRTNVDVLRRADELSPEERERILRDSRAQLVELSTLVGDVVDLARDGETADQPEEVRLDLLVRDAVARAETNSPGVRFRTELEPSVVRAVPGRVARAVANLLDNAAKWSAPGGTVEVSVKAGEVSVRDHGPGIDEADLPFVFDRFYRAPSARGMPGSGLGLAIVRQVAEQQGGTVAAENAEGGGARLRLRLPHADG